MLVDKEKFAKVVEAIDRAATFGPRYSFDTFCKANGLYKKGKRERTSDIFIACPFHNDEDPSLSMSEEHRRFKCFGCGATGSYLHFITQYDKECLGLDTNVYQKANELLRDDLALQQAVGFSSIFRRTTNLEEYKTLSFNQFKIKKSPIDSYLELSTKMIKSKASLEQIRLAITLMQDDIPPQVIWDQVRNISKVKVTTQYDLAKLEEV